MVRFIYGNIYNYDTAICIFDTFLGCYLIDCQQSPHHGACGAHLRWTIDVRPDGLGSLGVDVEYAGSKKLDFRQTQTRKIRVWGLTYLILKYLILQQC